MDMVMQRAACRASLQSEMRSELLQLQICPSQLSAACSHLQTGAKGH